MKRARFHIAGLVGFGLLVATSGCSDPPAPPEGPRLVILYATCTLNRDFLAPYDSEIEFTPNLARFAAEGVVFRRHTTESGHSGSAFASIFSGTQADRHGIHYHPRALDDDLYLISEAFADAGYETFFWSGHPMASGSLNYGQGITLENTIESPMDGADPRVLTGNGPRFGELLERLAADPEYRAFVQVNFTLTHAPYHQNFPPAALAEFLAEHPREGRGLRNDDLARFLEIYDVHRPELQYDFAATVAELGLTPDDVERLARVLEVCYRCSVQRLDTLFGRYLDRIERAGLRDDSLIAFTADHGEILYRENALFQWTHGQQLVPEYLDVPLIIRSPRHDFAAPRYDAVTRSIDLYPTLAGLCGVPLSSGSGVQGQDLSSALLGETSPPELPAYSHTTLLSPHAWKDVEGWEHYRRFFPRMDPELMWVRVREGDLVAKWRRRADGTWGTEIFDLAADPGERHDLFDPSDARHTELTQRLQRYRERLLASYRPPSAEDGLSDEEALRRLRDLGYVR